MRMRRPGLTREHIGQKLSMLSCGASRGYNDSERKTSSRDAQRHKKATVGITELRDDRLASARLDLSDGESAAANRARSLNVPDTRSSAREKFTVRNGEQCHLGDRLPSFRHGPTRLRRIRHGNLARADGFPERRLFQLLLSS